MGALMSLCSAAQCALCCTGTAANICCNACPSCKNSTSSRFMYAFLLLIGTIICTITLSPGLQETLKKMPFCTNSSSTISSTALNTFSGGTFQFDCQYALGYMAVYRICFGMACFFGLMAIIMIGVRNSRDPRSHIQNEFWGLKFLICIAATIGAIFIPNGSFGPTMMWIGMFGGLTFLLIQLIIIVDFAHSLAEKWIEKAECNRNYFYGLVSTTFLLYGLSLAGIGFLYIYFTKSDGCDLNKFLISFNLILCALVSALSVLPSVQDRLPHSSLLQSSLVTLYTIFLTWSAVTNNPEKMCNPDLFDVISVGNGTFTTMETPTPNSKVTFSTSNIIGLVMWMLCVLYSCMNSALEISKIDREKREVLSDAEAEIATTTTTTDNETEGITYSWSIFHMVFVAATLHVMMTLTNWYKPNSDIDSFNANAASMWIKIISSWVAIFMYTWSLVAPIVLSDREFSYS